MKQETKRSLEMIFHKLSKHPFLSVTGFCLLLFFFGFCERTSFIDESYIFAGAVLIAIFALLILFGRIGADMKEMIVIFLTAAVFTVGGLLMIVYYDNSPALILWLSLFLLAVICALMRITDTLSARNFIILMIAAGIVLRYVYCLYTSSGDRQHDVGYFNWTWGHANYIEYWYKNGLKLPDFDVRNIWQYYHPPLHHWLMALFLRLLTTFGMQYETACQALQFLPFLWSSLSMAVVYRIFRWANLKKTPLVIAAAIVCFHPTFVLIGGFFNNDTLCVLLMLLSIMFALKWYRKPTLLNIIPIALSVGLGMMTKLSAWMVAPAIAIIFLYVFIKNIKSWLKYIGQFAVFGAISIPLGIWWQVRNLIEFKIPLTYVPYLSEQDAQYCGNMPLTERLFDFGNGQLSFVYDAFTDPNFGAPYNEYNPTIGLIKTSLFGEGQNGISDIHFPQIATTGPILFWIGVILAILCTAAFVIMMISKKSGLDGISRVFFGVLAVTMLGSYYLFCFKFPFTCTMNIRYCVPLIPLFAMGLGLLLQRFNGDSVGEKVLRYGTYVLAAAFAVMTCIVYSQLAVPVPQAAAV